MPAAERSIGAHRWGLKPSTPRVLAARLVQPAVAQQVCRRGADAGAPQLVRLMVEHGGAPVPRTDALALEAERLRAWFPFQESPEGWSMPREVATAAAGFREYERFYTATLLTLVSDADRAELEAEIALPPSPTRSSALRRLVEAIAALDPDPAIADVARATAALGALDLGEVLRVVPVAGTGGQRYTVDLKGSRVVEVCPRELAERLGVAFEPVLVHRVADVGPRHELPAVHVPPTQEIGAIVEFATPRAAEEAMRLMEFKSLVVRRLDDRRVATRPSCSAEDAGDLLAAHGFMIDTEAS